MSDNLESAQSGVARLEDLSRGKLPLGSAAAFEIQDVQKRIAAAREVGVADDVLVSLEQIVERIASQLKVE